MKWEVVQADGGVGSPTEPFTTGSAPHNVQWLPKQKQSRKRKGSSTKDDALPAVSGTVGFGESWFALLPQSAGGKLVNIRYRRMEVAEKRRVRDLSKHSRTPNIRNAHVEDTFSLQ